MPSMFMDQEGVREDAHVSIPLGAPIYVPDMVGQLMRVPDFENSVFEELQSLQKELSGDALEACSEEISVDELKIITDDELVEKAFEEAFKEGELAKDTAQVPYEQRYLRSGDGKGASGHKDVGSQNLETDTKEVDGTEPSNAETPKPNNKTSRKRKKRTQNNEINNSRDDSYITKVEHFAKIKQRQEEQKASVRLHSFDSSRVPGCGPTPNIKCLKSACASTKVRASDTCENVPVQFPEAVLSFEVYHKKKNWMKTQEFMVLGKQFLTEVRDKIYCSTDKIMKKAGQHDPSGYFLIEDVFFNDTREPSAMDYSKPILDWFKNSKKDALEKWEVIQSGELQQKQKSILGNESKHRLPNFKSVDMQSRRFSDVQFRLGAGYLYCHQGDCKHGIVIRDIRLIHPEDVQNRAAYPLMTYEQKLRYNKCSVCNIYRAEKVTVDDKWASSNPCYFCDVCYYMLHYSNGTLLYSDFRVYDYQHPE